MKRRPKNKLWLFHREDTPYIIGVWPDGKIANVISGDYWNSPCYCEENIWEYGLNDFGKFPTRAAAVKAMKKYGKDVEYVGSI